MKESRVWDHSGLEAIHKLGERYHKAGKTVKLRHISVNCRNLLKKAGSMVDIQVLPDDPSYSCRSTKGWCPYRLKNQDFLLFQRIWVPDFPETTTCFHPPLFNYLTLSMSPPTSASPTAKLQYYSREAVGLQISVRQ